MSKPTVRGAREENDKLYCEKCRADLSVEGNVKFVFHGDGKDTYSNGYNCNLCGNVITITFKRSKEDMSYWE